MEPLLTPPAEAGVDDLLAGSKEGWRLDQEGRRIRSGLDPVRLVEHYRRIGAHWNQIHSPTRGWLSVRRDVVLSVLWLALAERGWTIGRQDTIDAWDLASLTPAQKGTSDEPI
jgi:hypothetical protein